MAVGLTACWLGSLPKRGWRLCSAVAWISWSEFSVTILSSKWDCELASYPGRAARRDTEPACLMVLVPKSGRNVHWISWSEEATAFTLQMRKPLFKRHSTGAPGWAARLPLCSGRFPVEQAEGCFQPSVRLQISFPPGGSGRRRSKATHAISLHLWLKPTSAPRFPGWTESLALLWERSALTTSLSALSLLGHTVSCHRSLLSGEMGGRVPRRSLSHIPTAWRAHFKQLLHFPKQAFWSGEPRAMIGSGWIPFCLGRVQGQQNFCVGTCIAQTCIPPSP